MANLGDEIANRLFKYSFGEATRDGHKIWKNDQIFRDAFQYCYGISKGSQYSTSHPNLSIGFIKEKVVGKKIVQWIIVALLE